MADATVARSAQEAPSAKTLPGTVLKAKASTKYYAGTMQTADSSGRATNPTSTSQVVAGVVTMGVDNSTGANDAKSVELRTGPHWFALHGSNPPTVADLFKPVYASDNQTISKTATDGSLAGLLLAVESTQCCVWVGPPATAAAVIAGITASALTDNTGGATADYTLADGLTLTALTDNGGGSADGTVASMAPTTALTVTDGAGTNDGTIGAITGDASVIAAVQELAAAINALITWQGVVRDNFKEVTTQLATIRTDLSTQNDNDKDIAAAYNALRTNLVTA